MKIDNYEYIEAEEFKKYKEYGYNTDYVSMKRDGNKIIISPLFLADDLTRRGFATKGSKVRYLNRNGNEYDRKGAEKYGISEGDILIVERCKIGDWKSDYRFKDIEGEHNTVMFESIDVNNT